WAAGRRRPVAVRSTGGRGTSFRVRPHTLADRPLSRMWVKDRRVSFEHFFGDVAGESHHNADGSDRQAIIPRCRVGELPVLEHEPDNPHDINAIRVLRQNGEQIGYLEREFAGEVVSRSAKGLKFHAAIAGLGRPRRSVPYGVALLIIVDAGGASDAEVMAYA